MELGGKENAAADMVDMESSKEEQTTEPFWPAMFTIEVGCSSGGGEDIRADFTAKLTMESLCEVSIEELTEDDT